MIYQIMLVGRRCWKHLCQLIVRKVSGGINSGQSRVRLQLGEVNQVVILDRACWLIGTRRSRYGHIHILEDLKICFQ